MKRKVEEVVQTNGSDDKNQISMNCETTPVSHIQGASSVKPISLKNDGVVITPSKYLKGESSNKNFKADVKVVKRSSYPPMFTCEICTDPKPIHGKFRIKDCDHCYCSECIAKYVASKIGENITNVTCPVSDCSSVIEPLSCQEILPREVFERWGDALCEAVIAASERFYCPFKDCSALLINEGLQRGKVLKECECPCCRRLFCAQCKVPWHPDIDCVDFQKLNEDERGREDIMLLKLAKSEHWMRCPQCKFYVERIDGCLFMKCRCKFTFCYNCGAKMIDHYCTNCKH